MTITSHSSGLRAWSVAAMLLGVLAVLIGCRAGPAPSGGRWPLQPGNANGFNVLLVTLDTVRRDRVGCYGDGDAVTPTLDRLAAEGVRFDDAVASVPLTLPSHATILTGLYPPSHGVRNNGRGLLKPDRTTLTESLRDRGYDTAAFIGSFVLDARFGLDQGFAHYDFAVTDEGFRQAMPDFNERSASVVTDAALSWLYRRRAAGDERPFFAWVHYFDAHLPYTSPLARDPVFTGRPYDAEIAFVDQQLGRLLGELATVDLLERTVAVVAADHGEALGEHGEATHGMLLYDPTVRVPMILSCPGLLAGGQVDARAVGLVDIRPTIEDLVGLGVTEPCDGRSLLASDWSNGRSIYLETREPLDLAGWSPLDGLRTRTHKLVGGPVPRLFDLAVDPGETRSLYGAGLAVEAELSAELARLRGGFVSAEGVDRVLTDEEREKLRALGYELSQDVAAPVSDVDPESMMPVLEMSSRAEQLYMSRKLGDAERVARQVLQRWPDSPHALRVLAFCLLKSGRADEAVTVLRQGVSRHPDVYLVRSLAQVLILEQEYAAAERVLALYKEMDAADGRVEMLRGDILARQGLVTEAVAAYRHALAIDPNRVGPAARRRIEALERVGEKAG